MNQLVPTKPNPSACPSRPAVQSSHCPGGSHSVLDLLQVQKAKKPTEEEHKEGQCSSAWFSFGAYTVRSGKFVYRSSSLAACDSQKQPDILNYDESVIKLYL